jgi:hypothetical protein
LPANRYGIVSGARNRITAVVLAAALLSTLEQLDRQREGVSSAALGPDHARRTPINFQLLPQRNTCTSMLRSKISSRIRVAWAPRASHHLDSEDADFFNKIEQKHT